MIILLLCICYLCLAINGFVILNIEHPMPYWFNKASIAQQSSDILYPICVLFEANASNPDTGVLYEYDDQYFLPNIEVVTEQFNAWLDEMKGFPYNWNVDTVLFYVVSTPTHCPSLIDDLEPVYLRIKHGFSRFPISAGAWDHGLIYNSERVWSEPGIHWTTVLHEVGHVMGLGDNYKCNWILGGRPKAIMNTGIQVLEDDIEGMLTIWQRLNDNTISSCGDTSSNGYFTVSQFERAPTLGVDNACCFPKILNANTNNVNDDCIMLFAQENFIQPIGIPSALEICHGNEPLAIFLPNIKPESIFIGDNVHMQVRGLTSATTASVTDAINYDPTSNRYVVVHDMEIDYPAAQFYSWIAMERGDIDSFYFLILPKDLQFNYDNIPQIDLTLSRRWSGTDWLNPTAMQNILTSDLTRSCSGLLAHNPSYANQDGVYLISTDLVSDRLVYCDMTTDDGGWNYIGYQSERGWSLNFWTKSFGVYQLDPTHSTIAQQLSITDPTTETLQILDAVDIHEDIIKHQIYSSWSYSNGMASKLDDTDMMIITKKFDARSAESNGYPKFFLKYDPDIVAFNNYIADCGFDQETILMKYGEGNIDDVVNQDYEPSTLSCIGDTITTKTSNEEIFKLRKYWTRGLNYVKGNMPDLNAWYFIRDDGELPYDPSSLPLPSTMYYLVRENSGCQEHFELLVKSITEVTTPLECAIECENNINCKNFAVGRNDDQTGRIGRCYLYSDWCSDNGDSTWNMYSLQVPPPTTYLWFENSGCRQHFAYFLDHSQQQMSLIECALFCSQNTNCKSFSHGRDDDTTGRTGWCTLYNDICSNSDDPTWNTYSFTEPAEYSLLQEQTGCHQHDSSLIQSITQSMNVMSCAYQCSITNNCVTFTHGVNGECYLYDDICSGDGDPTKNMYSMSTLSPIVLVHEQSGCQEHFAYILQNIRTPTTRAACAEKCQSVTGCVNFAVGRDDTNLGWCNLYKGSCTGSSDPKWDIFAIA